MQTINHSSTGILILILMTIGIAGCNSKPESVRLTDAEVIEANEVNSNPGLDDATRFGYQRNTPPTSGNVGAASASAAPVFEFNLPAGWAEIPPTSLRNPNFAVAGSPGIEAYITVLPGSAGGVLGNYNRWRNQMVGMEPLSDLSSLNDVRVLGQMVPLLDIKGAFTGMGNAPQDDFRLLGLAVMHGGSMVFIKLTGPAAEVAGQTDAFIEFISSLQAVEDHTGHDHAAHEGHDHPQMPNDAIHGGMPDDAIHAQVPNDSIHAGMTMGGGGSGEDAITLTGSNIDPAQLKWTAPEGWTADSGSTMRLASYNVGDNAEANCAVFVFRGTAGGVDSNINRWRAQMGLDALNAAELKSLPTIEMLDREAIFTEMNGSLNDTMTGTQIADATMYGLVCSLGDQTMFIKFSGPRELLNKEKKNFISFCQSFSMN